MEEERTYAMPMIGDPAPEFRSMTTMGKVNFPEDYKGHWVILFSHPADFTPVCTTEFITFARMAGEFEALNTRLIGLSIDSLHSHLAWAKSIEGIAWNGEPVKLPFPIIADISITIPTSIPTDDRHPMRQPLCVFSSMAVFLPCFGYDVRASVKRTHGDNRLERVRGVWSEGVGPVAVERATLHADEVSPVVRVVRFAERGEIGTGVPHHELDVALV